MARASFRAVLLIAASVALAASCQIDVGLSGKSDFFACATSADCLTGEVCANKFCLFPDGGQRTSAADSGVPSGTPDGGGGGGGRTGASAGQACNTSTDCESGLYCRNFTCAPDCQSTGCPTNETCDPASLQCVSSACSGCPAGQTCDAAGQCSGSSCGSCPPGTACDASGACIAGGADGGIGSMCLPNTATCQAGLGCNHLSEPSSGFCSKACTGAADCGVGADCYVGVCFPLCPSGSCSRPDFTCDKHVAQPACFPSCKMYPDACPTGTACQPDGTCQ